MTVVTCDLCLAINDSAQKSQRKIWNTTLFESENFLILPTIGPLTEGHVIIVSKTHYINLLSMSQTCIDEFYLLIKMTREKIGENILFYEHGSSGDQTGGTCIEHTHIHAIPQFEKYFDVFDGVLPISSSITNNANLQTGIRIDFPYMFAFNLKNGFRLYEAYNAHSQMFRKAICVKEERTDWDWKQNPGIDLINKTIVKWTGKH